MSDENNKATRDPLVLAQEDLVQAIVDVGATEYWAVEGVRIALRGHCLNRDCLRGSPAGDRVTARIDHSTIRYHGCECGCSFCDYGREQSAKNGER